MRHVTGQWRPLPCPIILSMNDIIVAIHAAFISRRHGTVLCPPLSPHTTLPGHTAWSQHGRAIVSSRRKCRSVTTCWGEDVGIVTAMMSSVNSWRLLLRYWRHCSARQDGRRYGRLALTRQCHISEYITLVMMMMSYVEERRRQRILLRLPPEQWSPAILLLYEESRTIIRMRTLLRR